MKTLPVLIVSLACAGHAFAQVAPAPAGESLVVAQAAPTGGASQGALPAATTGTASTVVAVVAAAVAAGLAAALSNTVTTASHH